jgi:tripartite-type tricarboxylate transporter receptor subunit TctC
MRTFNPKINLGVKQRINPMMNQTYKHFLAFSAIALMSISTFAQASNWPSPDKPIQITVPGPGGGGTGDTLARMLAEQLATRLKTSVIIENKPGANGNMFYRHRELHAFSGRAIHERDANKNGACPLQRTECCYDKFDGERYSVNVSTDPWYCGSS